MPTYLCHGFRWHRREIRIFVILNDIDDAAPDWIVGRTSSASLLSQFAQNFDFLPKEPIAVPEAVLEHAGAAQDQPRPHRDDDLSVPPSRVPPSEDDVLANDWSPVKLLEEYDVEETQSASRPYAFVADYVVRVDLSVNVGDEMARYEAASAAATKDDADGWFEKLRDKLQVGERIGWHIVVCADEERVAPDEGSSDEYDFSDEGAVTPTRNLNLPMRPAAEAPPGREQRPPTASAKAEAAKGKEKQEASQQPDFLRNDPIKTSPQPGLRHKLSTKGLRRLFSKKDGS